MHPLPFFIGKLLLTLVARLPLLVAFHHALALPSSRFTQAASTANQASARRA